MIRRISESIQLCWNFCSSFRLILRKEEGIPWIFLKKF
ncbi:hypothetical protein LEP1GSC050_0471 [Leptospira broomii serovar Hurstbridge str. 5399]|uniref:Uncharacterized protein n=1 Tax=Leptospira broomii serovar Hurstbridge str. 5399 TaxID=1049789 RepID=T0FFY1_9LEPT|nr:hypothetical protein LEP1GSC050_0471 [Leptospira broomii serovar Hurstbridge str. 5399]